jgi:RNA recognition motif-containing protein
VLPEDAGRSLGNGGRVERQHGEIRLLIRGIARGVASTEIAQLLAPFGVDPERIALPRDRRTRRRKGIAYVFVPSPHAARAAIEALNQTTLQDKTITIELAAERPPKKPRRFGPPGAGAGARPPRRF